MFQPRFIDKKAKKLTEQFWLNFDEPQVILLQGMRGAGKTVSTEWIAEQFYKKGFLILHLWGARSFENLYWAINKNCQEPYHKMKIIADAFFEESREKMSWSDYILSKMTKEDSKHFIELMSQNGLINIEENEKFSLTTKGIKLHNKELLHCNCNTSYPITWIVPEYIEVKQESLDRFNGVYFDGIQDFSNYFKEIETEEREKLEHGKLKKPSYLQPKRKMIVRKITPPTTQSRKELFREQFTRLLLEARKEHRIVVMNPAIFEGQTEKFETLAEMINYLPFLMHKSGHFKPLDNPKNKYERNHQNIVIVINEIRSVSPSSRLSGENKAGVSKKAIFDKIPEMRHMKTWFIADYQNPEDLFVGVRYQANLTVIKKSSRNILGDDWKWLFEKVENDRLKTARKYDPSIQKNTLWYFEQNPSIKEILDQYRQRVDELDENRGYVTFPNNEYRLETIPMPQFHHKESRDDFLKDSGIQWTTNKEKTQRDAETLDVAETVGKKKKKIKEEILKKIDYMRNEGKSFETIKNELVLQEEQGIIQNMGFANKEPIYFSNWFNRWKKKQSM